MINVAMLWFFLLPIVLGAGLWFLTRDREGSWAIALGYSVIGVAIIAGAFYGSRGIATSDTEVWNGQITAKARVHGSYIESYPCNCRTVYSGSGKNQTSSTQCDTCFRDHYTVNWGCDSTIGPFTIQHEDWLSSAVYNLPNPARWLSINVNDPVARSHRYTNYVQAVPDSLFNSASPEQKARFAALIPKYPDDIFDFYRVNRFVTPGYSTPDAAAWNDDISMMLRTLGPQKQVNAIVVIAKTNDPNYEFALRDAWEGANKNDVVLLIGSAEWPKIDFVRVITWSNSERFKIELRDDIMDLGTIQRAPIMSLLQGHIAKNFERRHMKEFEYLQGQIDPPTWLLITVFLVLLASAGGAWYFITGGFRPRRGFGGYSNLN